MKKQEEEFGYIPKLCGYMRLLHLVYLFCPKSCPVFAFLLVVCQWKLQNVFGIHQFLQIVNLVFADVIQSSDTLLENANFARKSFTIGHLSEDGFLSENLN